MAVRQLIGVVLIVLGIVALAWGGISWTQKETVVDAGPLEIQAEDRETIPLPPVLGGLALAAGVLLLVVPARARR